MSMTEWTKRSGMKRLYQAAPGERLYLLPDGSAIVAHPDREPKLIQFPGAGGMTITPLKPFHDGETSREEKS